MKIIKTSVTQQIIEYIKENIQNGSWKVGEKIPSEPSLVEELGVSRASLRVAIQQYVALGVLRSEQGKGTFITKKSFSRPYSQKALSFTEICSANHMKASAKLLRREVLTNPEPELLRKLELPEGSQVLLIERLRFADEIPIVIERDCFSMEYDFLLDADLENNSMYQIIQENKTVELRPVVGQRFVTIAKADAQIAKYLKIRESTPVLQYIGLCWEMISDRPAHTSFQIGYGEQMEFALCF